MKWGENGPPRRDPYSSRGVSPNDQIARLMRLLDWSLSFGRVWGIQVRIHFLFFAFILYLLVTGDSLLWTVKVMSVLFISVLLHEFGHCIGCRWMKGKADRVLLWPLGGLASTSPPRTPAAHFVTTASGPLVNLILLVAAYATLWFTVEADMPVGWNPFNPWAGYVASDWLQIVGLVFIVNYLLLLLNLALAFYPFDGGRLFQVVLWLKIGYYASLYWSARIGLWASIAVGVFGFLSGQRMLFYIALFGLFECYRRLQALRAEAMMSDGHYAVQSEPSIRAPREGRRAAKEAKARKKQAVDRAEIDRILAKVSEQGLQSLTKKEQKLLKQDTERLRGH